MVALSIITKNTHLFSKFNCRNRKDRKKHTRTEIIVIQIKSIACKFIWNFIENENFSNWFSVVSVNQTFGDCNYRFRNESRPNSLNAQLLFIVNWLEFHSDGNKRQWYSMDSSTCRIKFDFTGKRLWMNNIVPWVRVGW